MNTEIAVISFSVARAALTLKSYPVICEVANQEGRQNTGDVSHGVYDALNDSWKIGSDAQGNH